MISQANRVNTVGILSKNYAARRLFLDKLPEVRYKDIRVTNWCMWNKMHLWVLKMCRCLRMSPEVMVAKLFYDYRSIWPAGCDVFHFFNCINHGRKSRWVVSVESGVPWSIEVTRAVERRDADLSLIRDDSYVLSRIKDLASENCLALLPLSRCSCDIQMEIIKQFPQYEGIIKSKTYTLHPPQPLLISDLDQKGLTWKEDEEFHFVYVGKNFYRKGGVETLEALVALHSEFEHFKLTLISALEPDEERYMRSDDIEEQVKKMISSNSDWIEYHASLPNNQVLEIMRQAHVCLLPTWMDTYAYSVLESQACGTPVISTSLRALSEINNETVGWLVDVPVNRLNNPLNQTPALYESFRSRLCAGLLEKCKYVLTHREEVKNKARACLHRILEHHNPDEYARKLRLAYAGKVSELIKSEAS